RRDVSRFTAHACCGGGWLDAPGQSQLGEFPHASRVTGAALELSGLELLPFAAGPVVSRACFLVAALLTARHAAFAQDAAPFPPPKTEPPIVTPGRTNSDPPS